MTTDTTALQERLWEVIAEARDKGERTARDVDSYDVVAAVLPIIVAELQAAKAEALREAADSVHDNASSPYCLPCHRDDAELLHTIAAEYETGDQA